MSPHTPDNEKHLFQQIANGDPIAFRQIFDLYRNQLFATAMKMTKSQLITEEIVQEVFINLWVSRALLTKVEDPAAYIFRSLFNKIKSYFRKEATHERLIKAVSHTQEQTNNDTAEIVEANEVQRFINDAIQNLPPQQKLVYKLSRHDGLKADEIAAQLNISPNTAKKHLANALISIRARLKDVAFVTALLASFNEKF